MKTFLTGFVGAVVGAVVVGLLGMVFAVTPLSEQLKAERSLHAGELRAEQAKRANVRKRLDAVSDDMRAFGGVAIATEKASDLKLKGDVVGAEILRWANEVDAAGEDLQSPGG